MSHRPLLESLYRAISDGKTGDDLAVFFTHDAEQVEYPSLMRPHCFTRPLADMVAASVVGAKLIVGQKYYVHTFLEDGDAVAVQFTWKGMLTVDAGDIPAGTELTAHVAAFYIFRGDRILRQSSYDCYEAVVREHISA